ncbi:MAG: FtsX-like permease family protein [Actinomycetota bacterium]|nr:FtsX-like permease family protein [Actinomycetota bacterium]
MFRTTIKNLAARKVRLFTTGLAVLLGVAFMTGTLVLTDTMGRTYDDLFATVNAGTDAYVRAEAAFSSSQHGDQRARIDAALVGSVTKVDGVVAVAPSIQGYAQFLDKAGKPVGDGSMGPPSLGGNWITNPSLNPFHISEGREPRADGEVVVDRATARRAHFTVGDTVTVLTKSGPQAVTVVGVAAFGNVDSPGGASYALFTEQAARARLGEVGKVDAVKVVASDGVSQEELAGRIRRVLPPGTEVLTGAQITAEDQSTIKDQMGFFNTFLITFALVALFVGAFIIYNTFSILVAQRGKETALLRALGASRRQVLGSVLFEAVVVGALASTVGLAAGVGVAGMLKALFAGLGIDIPAGGVVLTSSAVVVSLIAGIGVSVASAVFPARKAAKVPPVAAMRDVAVEGAGRGRVRVVLGAVVTGLGAVAMASGLFSGAGVGSVGGGAALVFIGVAMLGPVVTRPLSRVLGAPLPRLRGMAGTLARENAVRNPKRTSATAAALMIGVALVGSITILAASTKASIDASIDRAFAGDFVLESSSGAMGSGGFSPALARRINLLPEVGAATGLRITPAEVNGSTTMLLGIDPVRVNEVFDIGVTQGSLRDLGASQVGVLKSEATKKGLHIGDKVPVRFAKTGPQELTVAAIFTNKDVAGSYVVGLPVFEANVADQFDNKVFVTTARGVDNATARAAITKATEGYGEVQVKDRTEFKAAQAAQIDQLLNLVYALLALAVFIALLGIANTLALSIFERTRELGLLRAVGMTRTQLRSTVRWESVIIAVLGTAVGLVVGSIFGWALVKALSGEGINTLSIPAGQLATVAFMASTAGVAAAILPARRAARLRPAEVLRAD